LAPTVGQRRLEFLIRAGPDGSSSTNGDCIVSTMAAIALPQHANRLPHGTLIVIGQIDPAS